MLTAAGVGTWPPGPAYGLSAWALSSLTRWLSAGRVPIRRPDSSHLRIVETRDSSRDREMKVAATLFHSSCRGSITVSALRVAVGLAVIALGSLTGCDGSDGLDRRMFVERLGDDTMAVETFIRTEERIEGTLVSRSPRTRVARYVVDLAPDGRLTRFEVEWSTPSANPEGPSPERYVIEMSRDSATAIYARPRGVDTSRFEVDLNVIPTTRRLPWAMVVWELMARQARIAFDTGTDTHAVVLLSPGMPRPSRTPVVRVGPNSLKVRIIGGWMRARVDGDGRVLGISGAGSTMQVRTERVEDLDVEALAADFAARDARGSGVGVASPAGTASASLDGATLEVTYGRPAKRGREIWGSLVPYDTIWRTGANAATHLTTDRDLSIGGAEVPAGTYTLWTVFRAEGDTLIINSRTRIWGTQYDPSGDVVRVPLRSEPLDTVVERFTIDLVPDGPAADGRLRLAWDRTRYWVPIRVR